MPKNGENLTSIVKKELLELDSVEKDGEHLKVKFRVIHTDDITLVTFDFKCCQGFFMS